MASSCLKSKFCEFCILAGCLVANNNVATYLTLRPSSKISSTNLDGCLVHRRRVQSELSVVLHTVYSIMELLDQCGLHARLRRRLSRRRYFVSGPNHCWHVYGDDKLKSSAASYEDSQVNVDVYTGHSKKRKSVVLSKSRSRLNKKI